MVSSAGLVVVDSYGVVRGVVGDGWRWLALVVTMLVVVTIDEDLNLSTN